MAFCTKCGRQLADGELCNCPGAVAARNNGIKNAPVSKQINSAQQTFNPAPNGFGTSSNTGSSMNFNSDGIKGKANDFFVNLGVADSEQQSLGIFERNKKIVPDCVSKHDGEIPIKQYDIAKLRTRSAFARAEGRLQVTNKRILFRAAGKSIRGKTTLQEEFEIDKVTGVEIRKDYRFNLFNAILILLVSALVGAIGAGIAYGLCEALHKADFIIQLFSIIFGIGVFVGNIIIGILFMKQNKFKRYYAPRIAATALAIGNLLGSMEGYSIDEDVFVVFAVPLALLLLFLIFLISFTPNLAVTVKTSEAFSAIEIRHRELGGKNGGVYTGFKEVIPWTDTDAAIRELGALIDDLHMSGDKAIVKWKKD